MLHVDKLMENFIPTLSYGRQTQLNLLISTVEHLEAFFLGVGAVYDGKYWTYIHQVDRNLTQNHQLFATILFVTIIR